MWRAASGLILSTLSSHVRFRGKSGHCASTALLVLRFLSFSRLSWSAFRSYSAATSSIRVRAFGSRNVCALVRHSMARVRYC